MTVAELIEVLLTHAQEARIILDLDTHTLEVEYDSEFAPIHTFAEEA